METKIVSNADGKYTEFMNLGLHFAYCNKCSQDFFEKNKRMANLIIECPNENSAWHYYYFYDLRDVMEEAQRKEGLNLADKMDFIMDELSDLDYRASRVEYAMDYAEEEIPDELYFGIQEQSKKVSKLFDKLNDEIEKLKKMAAEAKLQ